jgi:general secretion pathway protein D
MKNRQKIISIWFLIFSFFLLEINAEDLEQNSHKCKNQKFNIVSKKGSRIIDFVEQISETCSLNLIYGNSTTKNILEKKLNRIYLTEASFDEVLNIFLSSHNLFYELNKNILKISYIQTRTYNLNYINSNRTGSSTTKVQLSSSMNSASNNAQSSGEMGTSIESSDSFNFWKNINAEVTALLNRPEDEYKASPPVVNQEAGLITVSGTKQQLERLEKYLQELESRLQKQVLIEVHIYTVRLNKSNATGIDWSQFFQLQNFDISLNYSSGTTNSNLIDVGSSVSLNDVIKFLHKSGRTTSISNPKILTLNNQPALISVGNEYFYKLKKTTSSTSATSSTTQIFESDTIESIFAGILLDITPEISNNNEITLKINPSVSTILDSSNTNTTDGTRDLPPDITRKQLSSVITTKDGNKIILGGLITRNSSVQRDAIPLIGYLPIIGGLFRSSEKVSYIEELVLVITPHIIKNDSKDNLTKFHYQSIR